MQRVTYLIDETSEDTVPLKLITRERDFRFEAVESDTVVIEYKGHGLSRSRDVKTPSSVTNVSRRLIE